MEGSFSPILRKIAGEVISKPKRSIGFPTEICLENWWLSKPESGEGIAVSGQPVKIRKFDDTLAKFNSAPPKTTRAVREFRSAQIVKRLGCTTVETSDGSIISLCGFINKSRTQQNGFSAEVCRDFIYGFPFDWNEYAAHSPIKESGNQSNHISIEDIKPAALDLYNGAQLHDMVLSLTDKERECFGETCYNDLLQLLDPPAECETVTPSSLLVSVTSDQAVTPSPPLISYTSEHGLTQPNKKQRAG